MTKITKFRISEIIARIEMYGHGAGYTADEVLELAQIALATCKDGESIKLIDLLVQELPKRGGWPDDVLDCRMVREDCCEPSYGFFAFGSDPAKSPRGRNFCLEVRLPISNLDREEYTEIISRKQYEEALEASSKLNFEQWLEQQRGKIDVDCGCVSAETFMHWLRVAYEAGNHPDIPDSSEAAPGKGVHGEPIRIKPHVYRELVNRLRDTAVKYAATQQLRERISYVLDDVITPDHNVRNNKQR
ncbi:hypothetical protein [Escherichia coli]|uniref:hypothetical protein n=1 Tax=Escherichia coli TaxID=562 RepID=UPI0039B74922